MKSVLITGANRGIGLETVKQLSKQGLFVFLGTRSLQKGNELLEELRADAFNNIKPVEIDITKPSTILSAKNFIDNQRGKLDVLINNAGISGTLPQDASSISIENIREVFDTNFFGTIQVTQILLELLKKSESPRISNITSGLASLTLHDNPDWKFYPFKTASYGPSKTALNAYTVALAYELREQSFKVNVIDPGFTATDFNSYRGTGTIENAAKFIIKHTITDEDAPTGKFFSNDMEGETDISPW